MANSRSQRKRIQRSQREHDENLQYRSSIKTYFKRLSDAVGSGDKDLAGKEYKALLSRIDRAAKTNILHKNNAARKKAQAAKIFASAS